MSTLPTGFANLIVAFAPLFSKRVFQSVQVLLAGAILATGKRTVTAVLRVMGLDQQPHFQTYHRVLNRRACSISFEHQSEKRQDDELQASFELAFAVFPQTPAFLQPGK